MMFNGHTVVYLDEQPEVKQLRADVDALAGAVEVLATGMSAVHQQSVNRDNAAADVLVEMAERLATLTWLTVPARRTWRQRLGGWVGGR